MRQVGRQVQALQRERDRRVQLDAPAARVLEALDEHYQQLRQAPQVQLLLRLHMRLAAPAVPCLALAQLLRLQERLRAAKLGLVSTLAKNPILGTGLIIAH